MQQNLGVDSLFLAAHRTSALLRTSRNSDSHSLSTEDIKARSIYSSSTKQNSSIRRDTIRSESSRTAGENSSIATTECSVAPPTPFDVHRTLYSTGYGEGTNSSAQGGHRHACLSAATKQAKNKVKTSAQMEPSVFAALRKSGLEVVEFLLGDFVRDPEIFVRKLLSCCSTAVKEVRLPIFLYFEFFCSIDPVRCTRLLRQAGPKTTFSHRTCPCERSPPRCGMMGNV